MGIVTFTIDKPIASARIEFGRESDAPELSAPVDLSEPNYRTLLLGMKMDTSYVLRVVAEGDGQTYVSDDVELKSGFLPNALPTLSVTDSDPGALYGGFTVACNGVGNAAPGQETGSSYAFIFDQDGDYVWAYDLAGTPATGCSRARMSHDGKHLWAGSFANTTSSNVGALRRISMDGLEFTDFTEAPTGPSNVMVENISHRHHDFTVLPGGNILYQERKVVDGFNADNAPDTIRELDIATGQSSLIYDTQPYFWDTGAPQGTHANFVTFIPSRQALSVSMRHLNTIALISYPEGELLAVFSGERDEFGVSWTAQHGHHFVQDSLVVFNNKNAGNADVLEFTFDLANKTAGSVDVFAHSYASIAFGDVRRLPNGNTFITYSNTGHLLEIDASKNVLRDISTGPIGYSEHRKSLYGEPPHFSD